MTDKEIERRMEEAENWKYTKTEWAYVNSLAKVIRSLLKVIDVLLDERESRPIHEANLIAQYEARINKAKEDIENIALRSGRSIAEVTADYIDEMRKQIDKKIQANAWGTGLDL